MRIANAQCTIWRVSIARHRALSGELIVPSMPVRQPRRLFTAARTDGRAVLLLRGVLTVRQSLFAQFELLRAGVVFRFAD
jgi:hypothetical protein